MFFLRAGILCMIYATCSAIHKDILLTTFIAQKTHPFSYNLGMKIIPSKKAEADITICCHGYGGDNHIIDVLHAYDVLPDHLVGFNFPDYDLGSRPYNYTKSSFGSIAEILPLIYVIKQWAIDARANRINLYGFSAGGGAVINALAVLATTTYDKNLAVIGITKEEKQQMIAAIQKGYIILDCPLKSIEEIMRLHGNTPEFTFLAQQYTRNHMRPIDAISLLKGLTLTIFLYFEVPDEIIGNCDDTLFSERLHIANKGLTYGILGNDGGHNSKHKALWERFKKLSIENNDKTR